MLDIALVGTGGMMPLPNRFLSAMICRYKTKTILIDCGEGTQVSLKMLGWGFKGIDVICLTHYHADHVAGLPGLMHAIAQSGRTAPITLIGPEGLKVVVESLLIIARGLPFKLNYIEAPQSPVVIDEITLSSLPLDHKVVCYAYNIEITRPGKFDINKAKALELPQNLYSALQQGQAVYHNGKEVRPEAVMGAPRKGFKVSFATDTRPVPTLADFVAGADLYIGEGIYGEDEKLPKAKEYKHMLFSEAATVAKTGGVKALWLTHYSPSLVEPEAYLPVAQAIFPNTQIGYDRMQGRIKYDEALEILTQKELRDE